MSYIYFDNAATTFMDKNVLDAMIPYLSTIGGNPSSTHAAGREARSAVEKARKKVASLLGVTPGEIFFTSSGTESTNTVLHAAVRDLGCRHIITSPIEHHATLHTAEFLASLDLCVLHKVGLTEDGHIDYVHLEQLLKDIGDDSPKIVSLMHANNEVGNISDIQFVRELCNRYNAYFHTDAVQTMGHYPLDLGQIKPDFVSASAHKFHGPKGSGLLYIRSGIQIKPFIHGGSQERTMRSGTENVAGIIGFAEALQLSMLHYEEDSVYIRSLKEYAIEKITSSLPMISFNGDISSNSLYTVLNIALPSTEKSEMMMINLDIAGICVSGGSACSSGAQSISHVIRSIYPHRNTVPLRISFCKHNTFEEIDTLLEKISEFL